MKKGENNSSFTAINELFIAEYLRFESLWISMKLKHKDAHVYLHELYPANAYPTVCCGSKVTR